jgi:superfamily II DNA/RNA helicase
VATDVAARGLDIAHVRTVVNFDVARDIDTHTHRVGRTGRAGVPGTAYTLITENDMEFAGHIVRNLESARQDVPKELTELAMKSSWFAASRFKHGKGKGVGGTGLGFKERPALGHHGGGGAGQTSVGEQFRYDKKKGEGMAKPGTDRIAAVKQVISCIPLFLYLSFFARHTKSSSWAASEQQRRTRAASTLTQGSSTRRRRERMESGADGSDDSPVMQPSHAPLDCIKLVCEIKKKARKTYIIHCILVPKDFL